jgi:hypothetical protein
MKELLRGESKINLEAAVLKCPKCGTLVYLYLVLLTVYQIIFLSSFPAHATSTTKTK